MKIRLYRPVTLYLLNILGNHQKCWETQFSAWAGFSIKIPKYFWEIHLFVINNRVPVRLTLECRPEKDWFSIFYSYNLNGDLKKYIELTLVRKCRRDREKKNIMLKKAG